MNIINTCPPMKTYLMVMVIFCIITSAHGMLMGNMTSGVGFVFGNWLSILCCSVILYIMCMTNLGQFAWWFVYLQIICVVLATCSFSATFAKRGLKMVEGYDDEKKSKQ